MSIKRINLVNAINIAQKKSDYNTYEELLNIYYKLLTQENINEKFISEFIIYENISEAARQLISVS